MFLALFGLAAISRAGPPAGPPLTNAGEFWTLGEADKQRSHPLKMELTVYYYDPTWKLLWAESNGQGSYLPTHGQPLRIESGQRVRLTGTVVPAEGLAGENIEATVLEANALPPPLRTAGRIGDTQAFDARWVEIEGYVFGQSEADATHAQLTVLCEDRLITMRLQLSGTDPVPQLAGARIRARVVYVANRDPAGAAQQIDCWCPRRSEIEVLGWLSDDERFKLPRTAIDQLQFSKGPWVRLVGDARAHDPGKSLTLRDESGQVVIPTAQPEVLSERAPVEVVGRPVAGDFGWTLQDPIFRQTGRPTAPVVSLHGPGQVPLRLRLVEQVLQLSAEEADKRYPVTLRGVVTWADERADFFYLQDASGGVRVRREPGRGGAVAAGNALIVTGVTGRGTYVPEIELLEASDLGTQALPPARSITLEQALFGAQEGQRVEMRGFVRSVDLDSNWTRLELTTFSGELAAYVPADTPLAYLQGARVRLRGVCTALTNANHEPTDIRLWLQNRDAIVVDEPAPADPFALPLQSTTSLRQFGAAQIANARVHLRGTVLRHDPGHALYLQDGGGGVVVFTRQAGRLQPGEGVEVAGYAGRVGLRLAVRDGTWRPSPGVSAVEAQPLPNVDALLPEWDARLVAVEAGLRQAVPEGNQVKLTLQANERTFNAVLPALADTPAPGSRVRVTGIYLLEYDENRRPHGLRLELRSPADVVVTAAAPWWTPRRAWLALGGLAFFAGAAVTWVIALRRRVRGQTEQIRRQLEKEARLQGELERSSRLESLGVLAGGIAHDFNNLLTAVLGNLGLAAMDKRVMVAAGDCISEAERAARRARDITQQLLTFAKGGDPVRTAVLLPDIISEAANFARHGSSVRLEFEHPADLPPGDVDPGQISRVVHNLVINAVQAMPAGGVVKMGLVATRLAADEVDSLPAGTYLLLTVADAGQGIPAENLARIFDPYFSTKGKGANSGLGLATVRSIVKKHHGHIEAESVIGRGSTFRVWLPAATVQPQPAAVIPPGAGQAPARVLVMDDEDVIRRVAGRMLSLAGHAAVFAADGTEAVRLYKEAQQAGRPFDLVIFDLTVPGGMGGREALQELLRIDPGVRAIASSGYSSDPIMASPRQFGFSASLPKPYDIPDLLRVVDEVRRR